MSTNEVQSAYHQLMAHYFNNRIPTDNGETEEDLCQPLFWKRKKEIYPENKYQKGNRLFLTFCFNIFGVVQLS